MRLIAEGERDFKKISDAFYHYWEENGRRASDYKKFKRWEEIILPRLNKGLLPTSEDFSRVVSEYELVMRQGASSRAMAEEWQPLGPNAWKVAPNGYNPGNGRVNCITVDPLNPDKIFIGAASGGVWISEDAGASWETTTDDLAVLGITDIYVSPDNTDEVIAVTGDAYGGSTPSIGLIKSLDGGRTWATIEPSFDKDAFQTFYKLEVNPSDRNIMYVAGNGIYRTIDGGDNWEIVSTENVSDLILHPTNPSIVYAASRFEDNANEVTLYKSTDDGSTWSTITNTFDDLNKSMSRKALGVTMNNPDVLVVLATDASSTFGGLFKSSDALETLELKSSSPNIFGYSRTGDDTDGQGSYDLAVAVSPDNEDEIYVSGVHIWKSTDAGVNWELQNYWVWDDPNYPYVHADNHTLDFANGKLYAGGDGGIFMSADQGKTFSNLSDGLAIGQFYRIGIHPSNPGVVAGGLQDNGSFIRRQDDEWYHIYGADGMEALIDHTDPSIVYSETQFGGIIRYSNDGDVIAHFVSNSDGENGGWITPYIMHPENHNVMYFGYQNVWKSIDNGDNLERISDFKASSSISILKQHPTQPEHLLTYVDNILYITNDEGTTWTDITAGLPGWAVTDADFSFGNPDIIWATFSNYDAAEKVYVSSDAGATWSNISEGLPKVPVNCVLTQNSCDDKVYVGTDIGIFSRSKDTNEWSSLGSGLPNVMVRELEIQYATGKLFAATFGRGVWSLDVDLSISDQNITFTEISDKTYGNDDFALDAMVDSGLDIEYVSSDPEIISLDGNIASIVGAGQVTLTARQPGSCLYNSVSEAQDITVSKANQTITFEPLQERFETEGSFTLEATASSGLDVEFESSDKSVVFIFSNTASVRGLGVVTISAIQNGNDNFEAADPVDQTQAIVVLGIEDPETGMKIYPNPVSSNDLLNIYIPKNQEKTELVIYDLQGQVVMSKTFNRVKQLHQLNVEKLDAGTYVITINGVSLHFYK